MTNGLIHLYIGPKGSGKTNIVTGLSLRAAGAEFNILFVQLGKKDTEIEKNLHTLGCGSCRYRYYAASEIKNDPAGTLRDLSEDLASGKFGLMILDGILNEIENKTLSERDILQLMEEKHTVTELVLTGSVTSAALEEKAHLVTCIEQDQPPR